MCVIMACWAACVTIKFLCSDLRLMLQLLEFSDWSSLLVCSAVHIYIPDPQLPADMTGSGRSMQPSNNPNHEPSSVVDTTSVTRDYTVGQRCWASEGPCNYQA